MKSTRDKKSTTNRRHDRKSVSTYLDSRFEGETTNKSDFLLNQGCKNAKDNSFRIMEVTGKEEFVGQIEVHLAIETMI